MKDLAGSYEDIINKQYIPEVTENETIAERVIPPFLDTLPKYPDWVKEENEKKEVTESIDIEVETENSVEVSVDEKRKPHKAERVLQLIAAGEVPYKAARRFNTTIKDLTGVQGFKGAVKALIETRYLPNDVRRETVRAYLNDTLMSYAGQGPKKEKIALAAAKEIAKDPEVGLNSAPTGTFVTVDLGKLGELLTKNINLPGLEEENKE